MGWCDSLNCPAVLVVWVAMACRSLDKCFGFLLLVQIYTPPGLVRKSRRPA